MAVEALERTAINQESLEGRTEQFRSEVEGVIQGAPHIDDKIYSILDAKQCRVTDDLEKRGVLEARDVLSLNSIGTWRTLAEQIVLVKMSSDEEREKASRVYRALLGAMGEIGSTDPNSGWEYEIRAQTKTCVERISHTTDKFFPLPRVK